MEKKTQQLLTPPGVVLSTQLRLEGKKEEEDEEEDFLLLDRNCKFG